MFGQLATVAVLLASLASAAPSTTIPSPLSKRLSEDYHTYAGDGSKWPSMDKWGTFDDLWNANKPVMAQSCGWSAWGAEDTPAEIDALHGAITSVSKSTGVDSRFVLAIVMQESNGCVRVPATANGVNNPGLMQSHNGKGSCAGKETCPEDDIVQMVRDGTEGTPHGEGLKGALAWAQKQGVKGAQAYYVAARKYNSGSVDLKNLMDGLGSTNCYAEDVANRLTGWTKTVTPSGCTA